VIQNFLDDRWVFDACDNPDRATTAIADRDINIKYAFKPLCPNNFLAFTYWQLCVLLVLSLQFVGAALTTLRRRHINSMLAVWGEDSMITRKIQRGLGTSAVNFVMNSSD
jgi:hypothetical protein